MAIYDYNNVPVAQWIARWTSNPKVPGSSPGRDDMFLIFLNKDDHYLANLHNPLLVKARNHWLFTYGAIEQKYGRGGNRTHDPSTYFRVL